eukprot:TRINITY_DN3136_c0_g1_i23.p1 TRINITY_DN3136_c0_g1~~TRINITY_DN3136_c0_g1_i23.p1  ORF type:complete len:217 (+),score=43.96 TRINITY_DN3136_c0_g1_i23:712-1362(+)
MERCKNFKSFYNKIKEQVTTLHKSFVSQIWEMTKTTKLNLGNIVPYIRGNLNDRYRAIDSMLKAMLDFTLPVSHRYLMHLALNGTEKASEVREFIQGTPSDDFDKVAAQLNADANELIKKGNFSTVLKESSLRMCEAINRLFDDGKKLEEEILNFDQYVFSKVLPSLQPDTFINYIKWVNFVTLSLTLGREKRKRCGNVRRPAVNRVGYRAAKKRN